MDGIALVESPAQHMQALQIANQVRLARSRLKRRIAAGELAAGEVISTCPWEVQSMPIAELLRSQNRWGGQRCRSFLKSISMSETKTIGSMTPRERKALVEALSRGRPEQADLRPLWPAWAH
jgi:hypothetical protein